MNVGSNKLQNATSSDCRSFCGIQNPSGQLRKVSIGITVDKCSKLPSLVRKENAASQSAKGTTFSCEGAEGTTGAGNVENLDGNRFDDVENHKASAWFSTRSEKTVRVETPRAETVQSFINNALVPQSEEGVHKKSDNVAYGRRREKGGNNQRVEEVAVATMQKTQLVDKGNTREVPEKKVELNQRSSNTVTHGMRRQKGEDIERNEEVAFEPKQLPGEENGKCKNEALKMKLWEIFGTAPSENRQTMNLENFSEYKECLHINPSRENQKGKVIRAKLNSPDLEENKENLNINQGSVSQKKNPARARQNSDTIENDSESPNPVMKRLVTRSSSRKKAPPKRVQKLQDNASCGKKPLSTSSNFKLKLEEKNIFAFDEADGKAGQTSSGYSSRSKSQMNGQIKAEIYSRGIYFPRSIPKNSSDNKYKKQTMQTPDRTSSQSKGKGDNFVPLQEKEQFLQTPDCTPNDDHHSQKAEQHNLDSPLWTFNREIREDTVSLLLKMKRHSRGLDKSPPVSKNASQNDGVACRSMGRETGQFDNFCCPMFAVDVSPPSPSTPQNLALSASPSDQPSKSLDKNHSSKDLHNSALGTCVSDADRESSDDNREIHKSADMESPYVKGEEREKRQFSFSPTEEQDTESEAEDLTKQDFGLTDKWFPSTERPKKSSRSNFHTKRVRSLNKVKLRSEETFGSLEDLAEDREGSLARCVDQLALVLGRFKRRMMSLTSKRSSEVLSDVADKIRQQLLDVESQIQSDVGEFSSTGKSKRTRLESRFQDKQERLKLLDEKFKEEVNKHVMDCRTLLEELEAYNIALKGTADLQKVSHMKLIQKAEEAMQAQINDAESRIAAIHKNASKKMTGLKRALKEWMD